MINDGIYTISQYIECRVGLAAKILAIDELILAMELKTVDMVEGTVYSSYELNDGQMRVKTDYRSPKDVIAGITALEQLKQRYVNRLNGRIGVMRSGLF